MASLPEPESPSLLVAPSLSGGADPLHLQGAAVAPRLSRWLEAARGRWSPGLDRRFAAGAAWTAAGGILAQALSFTASVFLARYLGKLAFGELALLQSTASVCVLLGYFGLGSTMTKYLPELRARNARRAGSMLSLALAATFAGSMAVAGLLLVASDRLAVWVLASAHLAVYLRICAVLVPLEALNSVLAGALLGLEGFAVSARIRVITSAATLISMAAGAYYAGLAGALGGLVASAVLRCGLSVAALQSLRRSWCIPLGKACSLSDAGLLWRFSLPILLAQLTVLPVNWICATMLVKQPKGYAALGVFTVANQWYLGAMLVPGVLEQVVLPFLSEALHGPSLSKAATVLRSSLKANAMLVIPIAFVGSLASPLIMRLYGPEFAPEWPVLVVVLLTAVLTCLQIPVGQVLVASGRVWTGCWMNLGWAIAFIGLMAMAGRWGALGLAGARLLAYVVHSTWTFAYAFRILNRGRTSTAHA